MPVGLPVSRVVSVQISLTPQGVAFENFTMMLVGSSEVIDLQQRYRIYDDILEVADDFLSTSGEFQAAELFFAQTPEPEQILIGRWARGAQPSVLQGGILTPTNQAITHWNAVTAGSFGFSVSASNYNVTGLNFSSSANLNAVAATIQAAMQGYVAGMTCVWNAAEGNFTITTGTDTGSSVSLGYLTTLGGGTDISGAGYLNGSSATAQYIVPGSAGETALAAVIALDTMAVQWYALNFGAGNANTQLALSDHLAIAAYVEASGAGSGNPHMYAITTQDTNAESSVSTEDVGYNIMNAGYERTFYQFSSTNAFAAISIFGLILTVNYQGSNTTLDVMWKGEPGVVPEVLTVTQGAALDGKRYNYLATFVNGGVIVLNGTCGGPAYIDEIINMDAFANYIQTNLFNLFYTTPTKIPQTDAGVGQEVANVSATCAGFVNNGFLAPGVWESQGFGTLQPGQTLSKGYYVYSAPVAQQAIAARSARQSPVIQVAAKEAGAINTADVIVQVNR